MKGQKDSIHVTMYIASRKSVNELKKDQQIQHQVDRALETLMQPVKSGEELARRLSLPTNVPVRWNVEIAAVKQGFRSHEGHIPVMVSVAGVPNIMENLRGDVVEEITNILFRELRKGSEHSNALARSLGYETEKQHRFHLYLPSQVKVRGPVERSSYGDGDGDGDGGGDSGPPIWAEGGWSKGCSSWPW